MRVAGPVLCIKVIGLPKQRGVHLLSVAILLFLEVLVLVSSESCPDRCLCYTTTVKCVNQGLLAIPRPLPTNVKNLFVTGNNISSLTNQSFPVVLDQLTELHLTGNKLELVGPNVFTNLPNLRSLDLSNNRIRKFSPEAFRDKSSLQELNLRSSIYNYSYVDEMSSLLQHGYLQLSTLDLSSNGLVFLPESMFSNLPNLSKLDLRNNSIVFIKNGTLKNLPLRELDLRDNALKELTNATLANLDQRVGLQVQLAGNSWFCDCNIEELVAWLRKWDLVLDKEKLSCLYPEDLRHVPLLQVNQSQLHCTFSKDMQGVLETSYLFLGMVLALIGVIFLLVLFLNRKGIKRWMYNIRDACRDHMEGYHYRYEISSDPRLANLSLNSDV